MEPKPIHLWLDDLRPPPSDDLGWILCKGVAEARAILDADGPPVVLSLDHDLGEDAPTGYDLARHLEELAAEGKSTRVVEWRVHSANPVGRANIVAAMRAHDRFVDAQRRGRGATAEAMKTTAPEQLQEDPVLMFRPIGPKEKAKLASAGWCAWPPRLPEQPIFYPVTNEAYAAQIAREWEAPHSGEAWVTRFQVRRAFMERHAIRTVGSVQHTEWWIPADELPTLNANLVGRIVVIRTFRAPSSAEREGPRGSAYVAVEWLDPDLPGLADEASAEHIHLFTSFTDEAVFGGTHWSVLLYRAEGSDTWNMDRVQMRTVFDWKRLRTGRSLDLREGDRLRARITVL